MIGIYSLPKGSLPRLFRTSRGNWELLKAPNGLIGLDRHPKNEYGFRVINDKCVLSFFLLFWNRGTVIVQLSGFYCRAFVSRLQVAHRELQNGKEDSKMSKKNRRRGMTNRRRRRRTRTSRKNHMNPKQSHSTAQKNCQ